MPVYITCEQVLFGSAEEEKIGKGLWELAAFSNVI